jgi:RND family efflux transporter MFP subunit
MESKMKLFRISLMTIMVLIAPAVFTLTGCGEKIEPGNTPGKAGDPVKAPLAEARITQEPVLYEAVGTITARTASTVSGKLMGTVQAVHVREGDMVQKGDLLVTLDQRQVSAQVDKAQAALKEARRAESSAVSAHDAARAAADYAEATFKRYSQLLKENSVSQQEYEEVASRYRQAKAGQAQTAAMLEAARSRIQQAEAAVREATVAQKDAQVRAPYQGRIINKMVSEGDLASPGTPFFTIEEEGLYCADLVLPERHIQEIKIGMPVKVVVDALGDAQVVGEVGRIIPSADARSRSFQIKVAMPEDLDLKSGMFARVFIPVGGTGMLLIPAASVVTEGQLSGVFVVDDNQVARFRLIRTGRQFDDRVEVISGLQPGQRFVTRVPPGLKDGDRIEQQA